MTQTASKCAGGIVVAVAEAANYVLSLSACRVCPLHVKRAAGVLLDNLGLKAESQRQTFKSLKVQLIKDCPKIIPVNDSGGLFN